MGPQCAGGLFHWIMFYRSVTCALQAAADGDHDRSARPLRRGLREAQEAAQKLRARRIRAVAAFAAVAFVIGAIVGASHTGSSAYALAGRFATAWSRGDYALMYSDIDAASQRTISAAEFAHAYERAASDGDGRRLSRRRQARSAPGRPRRRSRARQDPPVRHAAAELADAGRKRRRRRPRGVVALADLSRPATRRAAAPARRDLPRRATLLARDGSVLAESPPSGAGAPAQEESARSSPLGELASAVVGNVGPVPAGRRSDLEAQGVSPGAIVGVSGLELALDDQLRGTPGGELLASPTRHGAREPGARVGHATPGAAGPHDVSPAVQRAAVTALGGQLGGIVAMVPSSGQILAVAGLGLDSLQPPGSTFKMVTVSGVLAGRNRQSANGLPLRDLRDARRREAQQRQRRGMRRHAGTGLRGLLQLGVRAARRQARRSAPGGGGRTVRLQPAASDPRRSREHAAGGRPDPGGTGPRLHRHRPGSRCWRAPLQMATVAATIGDGGPRPQPTFTFSAAPAPPTPALSAAVARHRAPPDDRGRTRGHRDRRGDPGGDGGRQDRHGRTEEPKQLVRAGRRSFERRSRAKHAPKLPGGESEASNTDAWFAAFAPALHPRIAVAVLLVKDGAGGETAAPIAREVLEAGLQAGRCRS